MRTTGFIILFLCLISLQSCFELVEQVFLKNDGSGNFQLTLNLSRSKTRLNSIIRMKTINGHTVPSRYEIENKVDAIKKTVAKTTGVSNVKSTLDFTNYIGSISFSFQKIEQVNQAVKNVYAAEDSKQKPIGDIYTYHPASKTFDRLNAFRLNEAYKDLGSADKEIFSTAHYTIINRFENRVKSLSSKDAKLSPTGTAVMIKLNALDIITEKKSVANKIILTN